MGTPGPFPAGDPSLGHMRLAALVHPWGVRSSNTFSVRPSRTPKRQSSTWVPPQDCMTAVPPEQDTGGSGHLAWLHSESEVGEGRDSTGQQEWSQPGRGSHGDLRQHGGNGRENEKDKLEQMVGGLKAR